MGVLPAVTAGYGDRVNRAMDPLAADLLLTLFYRPGAGCGLARARRRLRAGLVVVRARDG
jgi:hypothetical protein